MHWRMHWSAWRLLWLILRSIVGCLASMKFAVAYPVLEPQSTSLHLTWQAVDNRGRNVHYSETGCNPVQNRASTVQSMWVQNLRFSIHLADCCSHKGSLFCIDACSRSSIQFSQFPSVGLLGCGCLVLVSKFHCNGPAPLWCNVWVLKRQEWYMPTCMTS